MAPRYGWSERWARVCDVKAVSRGGHVTLQGALTFGGLGAALTIPVRTVRGGRGCDDFPAQVDDALGCELKDGQVVIIDHALAQEAAGIEDANKRTEGESSWLATHPPEFKPIEECRSNTEDLLRKPRPGRFDAINDGPCRPARPHHA